MKILIIHGTPHIGNTHRAVSIFKRELLKFQEIEFDEIKLPKALPEFCIGCHNCIKKGEDLCRFSKNVQAIVKKIKESDAIIVSSPIYVLGMTAALKNMFDHLGYLWLPHRADVDFFGKKTMVITTTAGAGARKCIKDIKTNLKWLGFETKHSLGITIAAWSWDEMKAKEKKEEKIKVCARNFYKDISKDKPNKQTKFSKTIIKLLSPMIRSYPDDNIDKIHWKSNNWL